MSRSSVNPRRADERVRVHDLALLMATLSLANCDKNRSGAAPLRDMAIDARSTDTPAATSSAPATPSPAAEPNSVEAGVRRTQNCRGLADPPRAARRGPLPPGKYNVRLDAVVVSSSDALVDNDINGIIAADLDAKRRAFEADAEEEIARSKDFAQPLTLDRVGLVIQCDEAGATGNMVSVHCASRPYLGGAHPGLDDLVYNFRICAGSHAEPIGLNALCRSDVPCREAIADRIQRKLMAKGVEFTLDEGSEAIDRFAITRRGLTFFVSDDLPQVVQGEGTIEIGFDSLRSVLRHDGALTGLLGP